MSEDLQAAKGLTYLFIAHDLSIVKHISNRIGVMYLGHLVELTDSKELYKNPLHPYTQTLLSAIPIADPKASRNKKRLILNGDIPSPLNPPSGCAFRTRCPYATEQCAEETPLLKDYGSGHLAACYNIK
jgi:oligopeptide transport system ATP-binding protein